jgi:hypothetical protein
MIMTFEEFYEEKCSTNWQDWTVKGIAKESWNAATEAAIDKSLDFVKRDPKSLLQEDEIYAIWGAGNGMEGAVQDAYSAGFNAAKPRWIPVAELKPDREGWFAVKTETSLSFDKAYFDKTLGRFDNFDYSKVTHWIDLSKLVE